MTWFSISKLKAGIAGSGEEITRKLNGRKHVIECIFTSENSSFLLAILELGLVFLSQPSYL